jgi:hypothetical protein
LLGLHTESECDGFAPRILTLADAATKSHPPSLSHFPAGLSSWTVA